MSSASTPELLAPAGSWECARAAVANGADAIFFGLPKLNARLRADNFTEEDLPELVRYVHARGVKAYVTLNTLVFTHELPQAERFLILLHEAGVDAAIVQDIGLCRLAHETVPDFQLHASTQMTLTSPEGLRFAEKLGITRAVLARELSLRELEKFQKEEHLIPLEVFVHGALCVAYSGQCLTSEALGQRSANRGECAQACRLPYQLVVDGALQDLGDKRYLLSPQDLAAIGEIPRLVELGIESFKIEGRLKTPEYVAAVTQVYRKAIDAALVHRDAAPSAEDRYKLEMTFSRGLYSGWMHGVNHQKLVHARFGKKRGPFAGFVTESSRDYVELDAQIPLAPGDGVVFDTGGDTDQEQGGRIYQIKGKRLFFEHGKIDFHRIEPGHRIWKTDDPRLERELRQTFKQDAPVKTQGLAVRVEGQSGAPLVLAATLGGQSVRVESSVPLQTALKRPLTQETLQDQLGRLGGTPYHLQTLENRLEGDVILPVSELNRLRRALVEELANQTTEKPSLRIRPSLDRLLARVASGQIRSPLACPPWRERGGAHATGCVTQGSSPSEPLLAVLCRSLDQLETALDAGIETLYADFEDIRRYREAVALKQKHGTAQTLLYLATPRIQKAGEQGFFKLIESMQPDGVLIRNLGALDWFQHSPLRRIGDFSLNVANPLAAEAFMEEGLERLTISYDLNTDQVLDLLKQAPPSWFELVLHQHLPMFHMEHCVFAAFLSNGADHTTCGRPCDRHQIRLRDRVGAEHPVKADVGCRNTVFHQKAQTGAGYFQEFLSAGLRRFRIELLNENAAQTATVLQTYRDFLHHRLDARGLAERLHAHNQLGVTNGTLTVLG